MGRWLYCNRGFDRRIGIVAFEREIFVAEVENRFDVRIQLHHGQRPGRACQLLRDLFTVVEVDVRVAERMHEIPGISP